MKPEEVVVEEVIPFEEQIEPFDWEDHLYETWLEEQREKKKAAEAGA